MNKVLRFSMSGCAPCASLKIFIENNNLGDVEFEFVEDKDMFEEYQVRSVPTLIHVKDGKEVSRFTGFSPATQQDLINWIKSL